MLGPRVSDRVSELTVHNMALFQIEESRVEAGEKHERGYHQPKDADKYAWGIMVFRVLEVWYNSRWRFKSRALQEFAKLIRGDMRKVQGRHGEWSMIDCARYVP